MLPILRSQIGNVGLTVSVLWAIAAAACSSPTAPGVSVAAAKPTSPSNGSSFSYYSQPLTLVATPGVATGGVTPTSTVEIATDAAFTTVVSTQTMSPSASGQVTLVIDHLSSATTYYWRVKTTAGNNPGVTSSPQNFSIGPLLVFQPPTPMQPLADTFPHKRPTFVVTNAARTGPPATVTYRFDVATDATFNVIVATGTVPEAAMRTSFTPTVDLTSGATYYWRVQAIDAATGVKSDFAVQSFSTVMPDDGNYRYDLLIQIPASCPAYLTQPEREFRFDNNLAVNGDHLRFALGRSPSRYPSVAPFAVDIVRAGERLSGTIGGAGHITDFVWFEVWTTVWTHVSFPPPPVPMFTGSTDNKGRLTGTFDGTVAVVTDYDAFVSCAGGTGLTWTLTPHP